MTFSQIGVIVEVVIWTFVLAVPLYIAWLAVAGLLVIVRRWRHEHTPTQPSRIIPEDCPCTGRPMEFPDCTCREPCGESWCQAIDPEEPMFYEGSHVIGRDGREAILRRAREEDQAEARADFEREIDDMTRRYPRG